MSEWKEYIIKNIGNVITGKTPSKNNPEDWGSELPFVTPSDYKNYRKHITFSERNISKSGIDRFKKNVLPTGSILVTCIGSDMGKVAINQIPVITNQQINSIIPNSNIIDSDFLFYSLKNMYEILRIHGLDGTAVPILNKSTFENLKIEIPLIEEQRAIASVLSSLDDKIDLLYHQNKTIEAMAETLFRQWFVEEAQEDWEDGKLGDILELVYGKGLKEEIRTGSGFPVVGSSGVVGYHSDFLVEGPGIVIGRKGTLGKVIYLYDNFFPIDTTYYVKSKVKPISLLYEYFLLKTINFEEINSDSAVPGLNRDIALSTEIKIVPFKKIEQFNQYCFPFLEKLDVNSKQLRTLEKLRDTLLPKLMSGEVRVEYDVNKGL